jgi:hypothetical protein
MSKEPKKRAGYNDRQRLTDYKIVFNSDAGRRVLYDLMRECHVYETVKGLANADALIMREGQRSVALYILEKLHMTPADIVEAPPKISETLGLGENVDHPLDPGG